MVLARRKSYMMPAYRPRRATPPPPADDSKVYMDLVWIAFTIAVVVAVGKFMVSSEPEDIIEFVEGEKSFLGFSLLVISTIGITAYGYFFYHHKRYEVLVDLALDYANKAQSMILQLRSSFFWLKNLIAFFRPNRRNFLIINLVFKSVFLLALVLMALLIGIFLSTFKNVENLAVNFVVLALYYTFLFSPNETRFERLIAHVGYTSLHLGTTLAHFHYDKIGYILINAGVSLCILCIVWSFVNVSRNQECKRRRRC